MRLTTWLDVPTTLASIATSLLQLVELKRHELGLVEPLDHVVAPAHIDATTDETSYDEERKVATGRTDDALAPLPGPPIGVRRFGTGVGVGGQL